MTAQVAKPREWVVDVCRTCSRLAQWPFCSHRPTRYVPDAPSWCEPVRVREAGRRRASR